jgi:small subunit ribosomal protein S4
MARLTNAKCRQCRQIGEKLFLRGERCFGQKCAMVKRPYPVGVHGKAHRRAPSEFGRQLIEKKRVKIIYGILERQLKKYFIEAKSKKGDTRENLIRRLEMRLDNCIFKLAFAKSRSAARQLVNHGHVLVNGKRVSIPSYQVKIGDVISLKEKIMKSKLTDDLINGLKKHEAPKWFLLDREKAEAKVLEAPGVDDLGDLAPISMIIESYSR